MEIAIQMSAVFLVLIVLMFIVWGLTVWSKNAPTTGTNKVHTLSNLTEFSLIEVGESDEIRIVIKRGAEEHFSIGTERSIGVMIKELSKELRR